MKLRPRLDALEAKAEPVTPDLVICSTPEKAKSIDKPATVIITGVPRRRPEASS
jgi:hypothetical protein